MGAHVVTTLVTHHVSGWYGDVLVEGEHQNAKDYHVTLGKQLHANVTGEAAYVVVPAIMTFKLKGKQVTQSDAVFTWHYASCLRDGVWQAGHGQKVAQRFHSFTAELGFVHIVESVARGNAVLHLQTSSLQP